jgi:serine/threonine protein kinase
MQRVKRTNCSIITINEPIVEKKIIGFKEFKVFEREVYWLLRLRHSDFTPKLISYDKEKQVIVMEYCGEPISRLNRPFVEEHLFQAQADLVCFGCQHNDLRPDNILVDKGEIKIIDFGWATPFNTKPPEEWPDSLGADYKSPDGFDDFYSIEEVFKRLFSEPIPEQSSSAPGP